MTTERIDVLAVMVRANSALCQAGLRDDHELRLSVDNARVAVANLINAVDAVFHNWDDIGPSLRNLRAARELIAGAA